MSAKRMFLIDGSAVFYRSYYVFIKRPLTNSRGENVSGIYGFTVFLMKILLGEKPDYIAVVFDTKEPTFRHQMYEAYKATRQKMPEDMEAQFPAIREVSQAFNVPWIELDGYEADDIIGTLARQAEQEGIEVYLATADKDFMQLLSPHIKMYNLRPGADSADIIDVAAVKEKYGLSPEQITDFLALMGDASDNVPGVPKVGQKTALELLHQFGSLEGIYAHLDQVSKPSIRQSLAEHRREAELSRQLVTIHTDVSLPVSLEDLRVRPFDPHTVVQLLEKLEFRSLIPRIEEYTGVEVEMAPTSYRAAKQNYQVADTPEKLRALADQLRRLDFLVFDTETTGLDVFNADVLGISLAWQKREAWYVPLNCPENSGKVSADEVLHTLKPIFENPEIKKGGQNIKFDALMLWQHGVELKGIAFDTMIAGFLISPDSRQNSLDALAERYLNYKMIPIEKLIGKRGKKQKSMAEIPIEEVAPYACEDADITLQLKEVLEKKLAEHQMEKLFYTVEMPLVEVLLEMEKAGVSLDVDFLKQMSAELGQEIDRIQREVQEMVGEEVNLNSPQQLGTALFDRLKIHAELGKRPPKRTPTGQYSTSEATLQKYSGHPVVNKILEYRKLVKLKSTYVDALPQLISPRTGRLHTSFNQTVAATGRLSSSEPNLQNIPIRDERGRKIRRAFVPADREHGFILSADYSQIELRVMAHMSGDPALIAAFERGEDIHATTAAAVFNVPIQEVTPEMRRKAKEVNFGIIYGISRYGLAARLGIPVEEAEQIIQNYFIRFPKVNQYMINTIAFAQKHRYVTTLLNRRRYVPDILSRNTSVRENAQRVAINTTIQGSAADLIKLAMIHIHQRLQQEKLQTKMILQVHDELVFEVPEQELEPVKHIVKQEMENALELAVPLKVDIGVGKNWLEAH